MPSKPIKLVLFDAAGVLFPTNKVVARDLIKKFGMSDQHLQDFWYGFYVDYSVGKVTTKEFLDEFADIFHIPREQVSETDFTDSFIAELVPIPGIVGILQQLQRSDATVALLSDTTEMFDRARAKLDFDKYVDRKFLSFEIGYKKPDSAAFQVVLDHYKLRPEEVFFIDDNAANIAAAKALGMQATLFTDAQALRRDLDELLNA